MAGFDSPRSIGITMGDPSGVGPEIICKAAAALSPQQRQQLLVVGGIEFLRATDESLKTGLAFGTVTGTGDVLVVDVSAPEADTIVTGQVSPGGGHAAYAYVECAAQMALDRTIEVIVTAPLNKAALHAAGHKYDGHTGLLQHLCRASSSFMLLASPTLSAIHVSTHVSLQDAIDRCRPDRIVDTISVAADHLRLLGVTRPRVAVAGLNPHCGEGGIFGRQEIEQIEPAVATARDLGIDVKGPIAADTVFYRATRGEFDVVVAQYHDQGHIPMKLLAFDTTVNVSLGLPIRRTSVDHGTAFDIAGTGQADHGNLLAALEYARRWVTADSG
jgi:4-hydroxythreonine-4-phosphate dehydrogenase